MTLALTRNSFRASVEDFLQMNKMKIKVFKKSFCISFMIQLSRLPLKMKAYKNYGNDGKSISKSCRKTTNIVDCAPLYSSLLVCIFKCCCC